MAEKKKASGGAGRRRTFAFVVYPESAKPNWKEILADTHIAALVSPLHDKDINPDGTLKKAHYHVMLMFEGVKSEEQFASVRDSIGGVGNEIINSARGYARYLTHKDNPEKARYKDEDVLSFGGASYREMSSLPTDTDALVTDMTKYIDDNFVYSFRAFFGYCRDCRPDWYYALLHGESYIIKEYIKSYAWDSISPEAKELEKLRASKLADGVSVK